MEVLQGVTIAAVLCFIAIAPVVCFWMLTVLRAIKEMAHNTRKMSELLNELVELTGEQKTQSDRRKQAGPFAVGVRYQPGTPRSR
jgi:hypothetical protein